jgi:small basic protein
VLGGVTLFLTGTTHNAVLLTIFYCACMFGLNCMIAPLVAVGKRFFVTSCAEKKNVLSFN